MSEMSKLMQRRPRRRTLMLASAALLAAALAAALLFPDTRAHWLAFFGGILVAVFSVVVSGAARSAWLIKRRTRQLERARERLQEQITRANSTSDALRTARERLDLVNDALPLPVLYLDAKQCCRHHNPAARDWLGLTADRIEDQHLSDIAGHEVYAEMQPFVRQSLDGKRADYEVVWRSNGKEPVPVRLRQVPWAPGGSAVVGFYLMATSWVAPPEAAHEPPPESIHRAEGAPAEAAPRRDRRRTDAEDRTLYLNSITEDIMGEIENPRAKLAEAMDKDEFLLFVQKIQPVRTDGGEEGYEILLRLKEEEDNLLPPGGFIPIAESYGMLSQLDLWVVSRLIRWCAGQRQTAADWRPPLFCVNLSEASVLDPAFAQRVRDEIARAEFPGSMLCFEIGEPEALNHHAEVESLITALKASGCRFTIDAFGSSRVSFSYMQGLAIDFVKIDGNIVHNIVRDPSELAKARAIHRVCRHLGVKTIAESVEQEETLNLLREIGIDHVQGFGIAAPAPIAMLAAAPGEPLP